jgi:ribosomal protein L29
LKVAKAFRTALREVEIEPFREGLKRSQTRLLKLRIERATGFVPGQA